jgi:hypothetical protein
VNEQPMSPIILNQLARENESGKTAEHFASEVRSALDE